MTLYLRPDADDLDGAWTNESGNNTNLYASLDETSASDSDYIQSPLNPTAETCRIALSNPSGGTPAEPFTLSYRFNNLGGTRLTVRLLQGTTQIASWEETGTGWTTQDRTLTSLQFAAISDFTNLFVELTAAAGDPTLPLNLDFLTATSLDSRITHTRASTANYFNSSGVLVSAAVDTPRFAHSNVSPFARLGLLIETQSINWALWNRDLTNAVWTKTNMTAAKDQTGLDAVASSASKITATAANATILQAITSAGLLERTQGAWVKRLVGSGVVSMTMDGGSTWTPVTVTSAWTLVAIPYTTMANPTVGFRLATSGDSIAVDYFSNETAPERSQFPTSPIATTTVPVQRDQDLVKMTGTGFSSWFNQPTGTWLIEYLLNVVNIGTSNDLVYVQDAAANDDYILAIRGSTQDKVGYVFDNGSTVLNAGFYPVATAGVTIRGALAFAANDFAACFDGLAVQSVSSGAVPTPDRLTFGAYSNGGERANGYLQKFKFYNVRKTNTELRDLTSDAVLNLDFTAMAGTLDSRVTFARASAATYFNSSGVLTSASSGAARFDYNPVNLAARGLLLEQQRTNNVARSQEINDGAWAKGNWTVTANAIVAPDGTTTADKLVETTATANRYLFNGTPAFATSGARTVTGAWYLKAAERTWCLCVVEGAGQSFGYYINLGTGTIGSAGGSAASDKVSITDVGGGWYRVTVSKTISFSTNDGYATVYGALADGGTSTYAGVLGSGFYVWGVQLEEGAFATSYIPTTTAAVTRAADQAEITGTNFSSWYNQDEGAFVTEFTIPNVDYWYIWTVSNFEWYSYNEFFRHGPNGVNGNAEMAVFASGGQVAALSVTPVIVANAPHSTAFAYKINDFALCSNGGTIGSDTGGAVPTMSRMDLGSHLGNKSPIHFARLRYYNVRKTDAELQALTT